MNAASTTSSEYDDHKKIDRMLYNEYGDVASIARNAIVEWDMRFEDASNISLEDTQNHAIHRFFVEFVHEQQEDLIEALANLNVAHNMPDAPTEYATNVNSDLPTIHTASPNEMDFQSAEENGSVKSSIISLQHIHVPYALNRMERSPVLEHSSEDSGESDDYSNPSTNKVTTHLNNSDSRIISSPRTPTPARPYSNLILSSGSFENSIISESLSCHNDEDDFISPSYNAFASEREFTSFNNDFFQEPTQEFRFDDTALQRIRTNTQSESFFQPFERSQSQNDLYSQPNYDLNRFSSAYFSQRDDNFENVSPEPSQAPSFSSNTSSQRNQPNLGNIRKVAQTSQSQSLVRLNSPTESQSGKTFLLRIFSVEIFEFYWIFIRLYTNLSDRIVKLKNKKRQFTRFDIP